MYISITRTIACEPMYDRVTDRKFSLLYHSPNFQTLSWAGFLEHFCAAASADARDSFNEFDGIMAQYQKKSLAFCEGSF
jgi:hypothetical protein